MPPVARYRRLPTEQVLSRSRTLDALPTDRLLHLINREDARVIRAVERVLPHVARAIELIAQAFQNDQRLFFLGAGTSGRLGVLEAAECPPTFHTSPSRIQALIAGGRSAVFRSREGAEDDRASARRLIRQRVKAGDVVVGISASGVTPFVAAGLRAAAGRGARTVLLTCNPHSTIPAMIRIAPSVGPEVLSGSTRLKAGTATKLILNMLTLGAMVRWGKTYGGLMAEVRPASRKLRARAVRIIQSIARCSPRTAAACLRAARGRVPIAVLMAAEDLTVSAARRLLRESGGSLPRALTECR